MGRSLYIWGYGLMIFKKLRGVLGGKKDSQSSQQSYVPQFIEEPSGAFKNLLDSTREKSLERGLRFENMLIGRFGANYRLGIDVQKSIIVVARAGGQTPEMEFPIFVAGTELVGPGEFTFIWPWAQQMFGLPPFPVWTEFANELQTIGGGSDGIVEFMTPLVKYRSELELNDFYMAIQGWGDLDAFYRLPFDEVRLVVFVAPGAI